jgi:hypothetical protein
MVKTTHRGVKTTLEIPEALWHRAKVASIGAPGGMRGILVRALQEHLDREHPEPKKKGGKRA